MNVLKQMPLYFSESEWEHFLVLSDSSFVLVFRCKILLFIDDFAVCVDVESLCFFLNSNDRNFPVEYEH